MNLQQLSDKQLIDAYISGKEYCLNELITRHQSRVYSYIMMSVKDRDIADDIFQDAFVKVVKKLKAGGYREEGKFLQWVMRITHNLIIDHFRKSGRVTMVRSNDEFDIFNQIPMFDRNAEDELMRKQSHQKIRELIELLPDNQREVLWMRHYADMSFKEIAEQMDISINTALGRMRYALINLRKMIEEKNISLNYHQ